MSDWKERYAPKYRQPDRDAFCRVCSVTIKRKEDWMVSWYSSHATGQCIHICPECITSLHELLPKEVE